MILCENFSKNLKWLFAWLILISRQCSISIPTENDRIPKVLGGTKMKHWSETGYGKIKLPILYSL